MNDTHSPNTKRCPLCAEEIQAAAIVCKHCGRDLPKVPEGSRHESTFNAGVAKPRPSFATGARRSLAIVLIGIGFMLAFVEATSGLAVLLAVAASLLFLVHFSLMSRLLFALVIAAAVYYPAVRLRQNRATPTPIASSGESPRSVPVRKAPLSANREPAPATTPKSTGSGSWTDFSYVYVENPEGVVVTFKPFLPRNDEIVIGAMRHVAGRILGVNIASAPPVPVDRAIYFYGAKTLSFMLVKEDSGEVHSFVIREM